MNVFNKIVSILIIIFIVFSFSVSGFAVTSQGEFVSVIDQASIDNGNFEKSGIISDTIPTIIIPGIGQTTTYLLDDDGNRAVDEKGTPITGWPLYIDINKIVNSLVFPLIISILTQRDFSLIKKIPEVIKEAIWVNSCGPDGTTVNDLEVTKFDCSVAELSQEEKNWVYGRIPMRKFTEVAGEDKLYFFGFNSTGDVTEIAKELNEYIEMVKEQTGSSKVSLAPISMGGTVATAWLEMFKENYNSVHKIVFIVPALNGSAIVADLMSDNLRIDDDEYLYNDFLPELIGETYVSYLLNIAIRFLPNKLLHQMLDVILEAAIDNLIVTCPNLWALLPSENFNDAYNKFIEPLGSEYNVLKDKLKLYYKAQINLKENIYAFIEQGGIVHNICEYGLKLYPLGNQSKVLNSDTIIQSSSTSMGATFANIGETFPDDYTQKYNSENHPDYSYISPDRMVDASTSYLPDNVWYIYGLNHEKTAQDEHLIAFATALLLDDSIKDVHSKPEKYPQFNGSCLTRKLKQNLIPAADKVDLSTLSAEQADELTTALNDCKQILSETVLDTVKCKEKIDRLERVLNEIGAISKNENAEKEAKLLEITKKIHQFISKTFGNKGFIDMFWKSK